MVIPSVGVETVVGGVPELVCFPMSNGIENWMQDGLKLLSLSTPLRVWNLVLFEVCVIVSTAKMEIILWSLKNGYTLAVPNL